MLQTINGFDLLLVITIVLLVFKVMRLNAECNDYVRQIIEVSWELQEEIQANKYIHDNTDSYCACDKCIPF